MVGIGHLSKEIRKEKEIRECKKGQKSVQRLYLQSGCGVVWFVPRGGGSRGDVEPEFLNLGPEDRI